VSISGGQRPAIILFVNANTNVLAAQGFNFFRPYAFAVAAANVNAAKGSLMVWAQASAIG